VTGSFIAADLLHDLGISAKLLNEIEDQRKRNSNRRNMLTRSVADSDGEVRGFGMREDSPTVKMLDEHLAELADQEARMTQRLEAAMKRHPLAGWIKVQRGLGLKQLGRLLAVLEDPSWHPVEERPRTLAELNSFCGLVPGYRRQRGVPADEAHQWSAEAKMRLFLISESSVKQRDTHCRDAGEHVETCRCGPYRLVYEQRRAFTADKVHSVVCVRCGPSGSPAQPGSPWPLAHQHGDALRYVGKRILRDLWREARRVHGYPDEVADAA
jgi:hypothetical protein